MRFVRCVIYRNAHGGQFVCERRFRAVVAGYRVALQMADMRQRVHADAADAVKEELMRVGEHFSDSLRAEMCVWQCHIVTSLPLIRETSAHRHAVAFPAFTFCIHYITKPSAVHP